MTQHGLFTKAEDFYLIGHYSTTTLVEMARHLGCRRYQVVQHRVNLLIRRGVLRRQQRYYSRPWTQEEDDWLSDHWGLLPDGAVAKHLRRSIEACEIRTVRALSICRKAAFYTARNIAAIFGVDVHLVIRQWIASGHLKACKSNVRCGDGYIMWQITDEAITAFIQQYPWHYDRTRMERGSWWRNMADRVWARDPWLTVDEAAVELEVCSGTVNNHIRRGWLKAERTWGAGGNGEYRIPRSALGSFRLRKDPVTVTPALAAWYKRGRQEVG